MNHKVAIEIVACAPERGTPSFVPLLQTPAKKRPLVIGFWRGRHNRLINRASNDTRTNGLDEQWDNWVQMGNVNI